MKRNQIFWVQTALSAKMVFIDKNIFGCYHANTYSIRNVLMHGSQKTQVAQYASTSLQIWKKIIKEKVSLNIQNSIKTGFYFTVTRLLWRMKTIKKKLICRNKFLMMINILSFSKTNVQSKLVTEKLNWNREPLLTLTKHQFNNWSITTPKTRI